MKTILNWEHDQPIDYQPDRVYIMEQPIDSHNQRMFDIFLILWVIGMMILTTNWLKDVGVLP